MSDPRAAAVAAAAFTALFAAHMLGDHVLQRHHDSLDKGLPGDDRLADGVHPWTGWAPSLLRHIGTYTATQAAALALVALVAPIGWAGALAALWTSASTHAVIDRRWPVRLLLRWKGCDPGWTLGPYLVDQSLHIAMLFVAAVLAALVNQPAMVVAVAAAAMTLVVAALLVEFRLADRARANPVDPLRM